eukprot:TRINITY_DN19700_c0_g1_i1.p1 TRINITY_DN19700_c0_g1~~TRINITY_DN19700_c0_g1_i1.p1  ORF type:complete len:189 (-),score=48.86 TRINITY_DN19700_c0_g1_i1:57-623(-)
MNHNNNHHLLFQIPHCIWPLFILPTKNTEERHEAWTNVLSTCTTLRKNLLPIFNVLKQKDYYEALQGCYIKTTYQNDYYLHINGDQLIFSIKYGEKLMRGEPVVVKNQWDVRTGEWVMERKVVSDLNQVIVVYSPAFSVVEESENWGSMSFTFGRFLPHFCQLGDEMKRSSKQLFEEHKRKPKFIFSM